MRKSYDRINYSKRVKDLSIPFRYLKNTKDKKSATSAEMSLQLGGVNRKGMCIRKMN